MNLVHLQVALYPAEFRQSDQGDVGDDQESGEGQKVKKDECALLNQEMGWSFRTL